MSHFGKLLVVGTPIGNIKDVSLRAMRVLAEAEVIVCEDTRVTGKLLSQLTKLEVDNIQYKSKPALFRLDENVQLRMIPKVIAWLETGTNVVMVTDAGMPCISDPGWKVVDAVREAGYEVEVIPGPSALDTAVVVSGMDASKVLFLGFLPKKEKHQQETVEQMRQALDSGLVTMAVLYESPKRLRDTLGKLEGLQVAACGELTKMHEKVIRGSVKEVLAGLPHEVKGEWVVVVGK